MLPLLQTLALTLAGLVFLALLGFPVVRLALPADLRDEYGHIIAPGVGYMVLCLFAFALSGSARIPASAATLAVVAVLVAASVVLWWRDRVSPSAGFGSIRARGIEMLVLMAPLAIVMLWPYFLDGADTYLGAVNPDYFAGLVDDYFLLKGHSIAEFTKGRDTFQPLDYMAGSISSSGRFASGLFAVALSKLTGLDIRTTLTLSIALFMCCLPPAIFFFARTVFGLERGAARVAAWLIGISTPIAMSYLYFYLGQNSGLAALTITLSLGYLLLTRPDWRLLVSFALMVNALLVVYLGMLPYAVAPLGVLGVYQLVQRRLGIAKLAALAAGFIVVSLVVNFAMIPSLYAMVRGWGNVIGQTLQGQYFLDFLTEAYFPLFLGTVLYPLQSSWYYAAFGPKFFVAALVLAAFVLAAVVTWGIRWARTTPDRARVVTIVSAIAIYAVVWWVYSFQRQYGYAVFKMSSWLQFMLVPFVAYGWHALRAGAFAGWKRAALGGAFALYVVTNLLGTLEYGVKGLGNNPTQSYIVNNFQMSGNRDYFDLAGEVRKHVKPQESVGLDFVDSIQNFWVAYYLRGSRLSLLAHENIPGDDENLPNIDTNMLVDYYGNVREANNVFFHGAADDYYLVWGASHINRDIAEPRFTAPPVWQDGTFRLFRAADNPDMVFTGRGYYRMEYNPGGLAYWWPQRARWTAEGGEVYLLRPANPGTPRRLMFDAVVGYEHRDDARTIELYADKVKFDEIRVTSAARYVSKPFVPKGPVTKLVIKVRERVAPSQRPLPLWNKSIPLDYRQLNVLLANVHVLREGEVPIAESTACGGTLRGVDLLRCARSFNGVQIDRWIGRHASFTLPADATVTRATVKGHVPSGLDFTFPYRILFRVNGTEVPREVAAAGDFSLDIPVEGKDGELALDIEPSQARDREDERPLRHKIVTHALRLESVVLQ
jgi:hypothetical protein